MHSAALIPAPAISGSRYATRGTNGWVARDRRNHGNRALRTTLNPVQPACIDRRSPRGTADAQSPDAYTCRAVFDRKYEFTVTPLFAVHAIPALSKCKLFNDDSGDLPVQNIIQSTGIDELSFITRTGLPPFSMTSTARCPRCRLQLSLKSILIAASCSVTPSPGSISGATIDTFKYFLPSRLKDCPNSQAVGPPPTMTIFFVVVSSNLSNELGRKRDR
mmetsp:Transcript_4535/g.10147  ORF Transcript_4535/g.10147 Transcript_4535/m.10147 type:complete len:219 (+) Transcript_4535:709-1365(+)